MTYRTAKLPLNIISERLRWWRKQKGIKSIEAYVHDCVGWLVIKFAPKETQAQRNERLIRSLPKAGLEAKRLKLEEALNQIKEEQK